MYVCRIQNGSKRDLSSNMEWRYRPAVVCGQVGRIFGVLWMIGKDGWS